MSQPRVCLTAADDRRLIRQIDEQLISLGATRIVPLGIGDDSTDFEAGTPTFSPGRVCARRDETSCFRLL